MVPRWALDALSDVYDPCCQEKGISVVDMGLVRAVHENGGGHVRVELLLTSGWCPFAARVLTDVRDRIAAQPGVDPAAVAVGQCQRERRGNRGLAGATLARDHVQAGRPPDTAPFTGHAGSPLRGDPP